MPVIYFLYLEEAVQIKDMNMLDNPAVSIVCVRARVFDVLGHSGGVV